MLEPAGTDGEQADECQLHAVAEFRRQMDAYQTRSLIVRSVCLVALCGSIFAFAALVNQKELGPPREPSLPRMIVGGGFFLMLFLMIGGAAAVTDSISRKYGADCKRCGKRLQALDLNYAIAMHCCPHCQRELFTEWKSSSVIATSTGSTEPCKGTFTFAEIEAAERNRRRVFWRCLFKTALVVVPVFGITSACVWADGGMLAERFGDWAPDIAKTIRVIPAFLAFGVGLLWSIRRAQSASPICCHGCCTPIQKERMLRLTGNCQNCGRRVISDAPLLRNDGDSSEAKLIEHAELAAWVAHHRICMAWSIVIIVGIGGFGWNGLVFWWCGKTGMHDGLTIVEFMTAIAGLFVLIMVLGWMEYRLKLQRRCPYCKRSLLAWVGLVQVTGNCGHCGRRVLASAE